MFLCLEGHLGENINGGPDKKKRNASYLTGVVCVEATRCQPTLFSSIMAKLKVYGN